MYHPRHRYHGFLLAWLCCWSLSSSFSTVYALTTTPTTTAKATKTNVQVVLFGVGDLRVDDHVGLVNAMIQATRQQQQQSDETKCFVMPLFLGHSQMLKNIPGMKSHPYDTSHLLVAALQQLQESLQQLDLTLSYVDCSNHDTKKKKKKDDAKSLDLMPVIQQLVQAALSNDDSNAQICIHVCDLGPADQTMQYGPYAHLAAATADVTVRPWKASLRDIPTDQNIPDDYPSFQARYASVPFQSPLYVTSALDSSSSSSFKCLSSTTTTLPTATDILIQINRFDAAASCTNTGLYATHWGGLSYETVGCQIALEHLQAFVQHCQQDDVLWFASPKRAVARANPNSLEHASMQWQLQTNNMKDDDLAGKPLNWLPGESIIRFLTAPLLFGTVSARRIHYLSTAGSAVQPWSNLFKNSSPLESMVLAREWHVQLAEQHLRQEPSAKYWRYHGFLCRYFETELSTEKSTTSSKQESPTEALLWVHGFGASGAQWKGTVEALQKQQHTAHMAFCPDLLGFGHSEKPAVSYTGYMWESQMLDFVKEIVSQDTYIVGGNSIGGYTALSLAASDMASSSRPLSASGAPGTKSCTGLVLLNSAGPVLREEEITPANDKTQLSVAQQTQRQQLPPCSPPPRWIGRAFGNALLQYLRPRIQSICVNLYPTNPSAVSSDLCDNIRRDSLDPGAIYVMMAGAKLPLPRTANELLQADSGAGDKTSPEATFGDRPVLIAQGVLDPLNDAQDRLERFAALRVGVTAAPIQAGHCPHDEVPELVADEVSKWLRATQATRAAFFEGTTARAVESRL